MTDYLSTHWGEAPCASNYNLRSSAIAPIQNGLRLRFVCFFCKNRFFLNNLLKKLLLLFSHIL